MLKEKVKCQTDDICHSPWAHWRDARRVEFDDHGCPFVEDVVSQPFYADLSFS